VSDASTAGRYRQYLLGELPDEERDALEESYFTSDESLAELQDAEDELIDAYEAGALTPEDRVRFETRYLASTPGARRLWLERSLKRLARDRPSAAWQPMRPARAAWLAWVAALAIAALAASLLASHWRLQHELQQAQARNEALRQQAQGQGARIDAQESRLDALRGELERMRDRAEQVETLALDPERAARLVSILLRPGLKRDLQPVPELVVAPDAVLVRIVLATDEVTAGRYRASLQTVEGREVWSSSHLRARASATGRMVDLTVPAQAFEPGHHVVVLSADRQPDSPLAEYVFRVRRP
jgi:hypothetical protein